MKRLLSYSIVTAAFAAFVGASTLPSSAAIVNFEDGALDTTLNTYTESGIVFSPIASGDLVGGNCPTDDPDCLKLQLTTNESPGTKAKAKMESESGLLLTLLGLAVQYDGNAILSIYRDDPNSDPLEICLGGDADPACDRFTTEAFASDSTSPGPNDFLLDFTQLAEFGSFFTGAQAFFFDNDAAEGTLRLDNIAVNAIPLPASLLFLLTAVCGLGFIGRRRRAQAIA